MEFKRPTISDIIGQIALLEAINNFHKKLTHKLLQKYSNEELAEIIKEIAKEDEKTQNRQ